RFLGLKNLEVLVYDGTITGLVALGMLLIIISGGIDLSVGSVVALVTVVSMKAYTALYARTDSVALASLGTIPVGILVGGACGLTNGLVITVLRVSPFVATLGMFSIARGLALLVAERVAISFPGGKKPGWAEDVTRVHFGNLVEFQVGDVNLRVPSFNPGFWSLVVLAA